MHARTKIAAALAASFLLIGQAHAALPTEITTAFTSISDTVTGILALVWPIATTLVVGFVGLKLFKKGANKAS